MFSVAFSSEAERFLRKIEKETARRIIEKIEKLRIEPFPSDVRGLLEKGIKSSGFA
jgi:mRNA-degrading endonuclease RelE of RelBE toxin-antitoxin system